MSHNDVDKQLLTGVIGGNEDGRWECRTLVYFISKAEKPWLPQAQGSQGMIGACGRGDETQKAGLFVTL